MFETTTKNQDDTYLPTDVFISEEEPRTEIFFRDVFAVCHDESTNPRKDNILYRFCRDTFQAHDKDRRIPHPVHMIGFVPLL